MPRHIAASQHAACSDQSLVSASTLIVHVGYGLPRAGLPAASSFRRWVTAALAGTRYCRPTEISIRLVDEAEGRDLNRTYRGKGYATNVLSFPAESPPGIQLALLGDIALCAPVVLREAHEQSKRPRDHFAHLTVHGVLHLLGMEHQTSTEAVHMEALEVRILTSLDIPDPYR